MLQNTKVIINNKSYKFFGTVHKREILNGNIEVPEGYELKKMIRKIKNYNIENNQEQKKFFFVVVGLIV